MRWFFALVAASIGLVPAVAAAQSSVPPLPPIGGPLPPIGLPLPPIGLPPVPSIAPQSRQTTPREPQGHARRGGRVRPGFVFVVPAFPWTVAPPLTSTYPGTVVSEPVAPPPAPRRPAGVLRFELDHAGAVPQVWVDGYFVGSPDEFGHALTLDEGSHEVQIRATGYETIVVDVKIVADRTITYRDTMQRLESPPSPEPSATRRDGKPLPPKPSTLAPPSTFYFIPGCYIGNVPPEQVDLPATCDLSKLVTRKPSM